MQFRRFMRGLALVGATALATQLAPAGASVAQAATTPPPACPTSISYGTTIGCSLAKAGEVDTYALTAAAGDTMFVHVVGAAGFGLDVDFDVRDPGGTVICSARAGASTSMPCKAAVAGKHAIAVFDAGADEAGNYKISAQRANKPVGALAVSVARPRQGVFAVAGESDWYTFAGVANTTAIVRGVVIGSAPSQVDLTLFSPTGDVLCATRAGLTAQSTCPLPVTGTYVARIADSLDDQTGAYAISVRPECTINGTTGADTIVGSAGPDVICGLGGADTIKGGDGADVLIGGTGDDKLDGGAGADVFVNERLADGADTFTGGSATDVLSYIERSVAVSSDPDVVADDGEVNERDDVRADVETIIGGAGNDTFLGGAIANTFIGGFGNDTLDGAGGNDTFIGNADVDGTDLFTGGAGSDAVTYAERSVPIAIDPDGNADDGASGERDTVRADIESFTSGSSTDVIAGGPAAETINGGAGDDVLDGGMGDDTVDGDAGNDVLFVRVGDGADVLIGGSGTDSVSYAGRSAAVKVSLNGVADDGEANERDDVRADIENVIGGAGADTIVGSPSANRLEGGPGADSLQGMAGNDTLVGGPGYDSLDGGEGTDVCDAGPDSARVVSCDRT